jgi:membrane associated rhomboid family serine protease
MFVHGSFGHILFNMLGLFIFGPQLERQMGSTEFLVLYLFTGIGTGFFSFLMGTNVVGASGAIYGLLLAFATYFPDARIFIWGILPLRAPIAVILFAGLSLFFHFSGVMGGVAHLAHLAGIVLAYFYFVVRLGINPIRVFTGRR